MTWRRSSAALWRRTPAHVVAATRGQPPHILSGVGRDLWDLLDAPRTTDDLLAQVGPAASEILTGLRAAALIDDDGRAPSGPVASPERGGPSERSTDAGPPSAPGGGDPLVGAMTFWLPGGPDRIRTDPLTDDGWTALMDTARRQRCFGPLCWAVGTGALPTSPEQREEAERYAILLARHAIEQEAQLLDVSDVLSDAGIEVRVLKGLAVAHLDHLDPSFRASADLDLLVRSADLGGAVERLVAEGFERDLPERRAGYDERFGKDVTLQALDRYEIDVHRLPLAGPLGFALDPEVLWSHHEVFEIGGVELRALDAAGRFAHAAWSLALTDPAPRLVPALDMVAIPHSHAIDPHRLELLAPAGGGRLALDLATQLAVELLGRPATAELPVPRTHASSRWDRALIRTYPGQGGSKAANLLAAAASLPTWRDRGGYLLALLVPSAGYRTARRDEVRRPEWRIALGGLRRRRLKRRPSP